MKLPVRLWPVLTVCFLFSCLPKPKESKFFKGSGTWNIDKFSYAYDDGATEESFEELNVGFFMFLEAYGDMFITDPDGNSLDSFKGLYYLKTTTPSVNYPPGTSQSEFDYVLYENALNIFPSGGSQVYDVTQFSGNKMILTRYSTNTTITLYLSRMAFTGPMPDYE